MVRDPASATLLAWAGFPLLGAGAGWLVRLLAEWVVSWPWAPFQGPAELIASLPEPALTVGALVVGALAGIVVAGIGQWESLVVTVDTERIRLARKGSTSEFTAGTVHAGCLDGKYLVLLGHDGAELAREPAGLDRERLTGALREHGHQWLDEDPYLAEFRLWVPDTPGLPAGANALLAARQKHVGKIDGDSSGRELRDELAKLGVVVRDRKKQQYWRLVRQADS
ncbi:hypothetical protein CFN78_27365 [Amycolatopsis antarctica]|uniref:DUF308 domain-containing protein n=1 Tax=Amycolatopsis antarctica TaxID=1854586 RepID=A0A263CY90_9PSEU|nr:hypothetical protein CFN78_27365 [Amycolatopsis antarctica]